MAGNHRSGRPGKPTEKHIADGTFRADRHGTRDESAGGLPIKPDELDENGNWCWEFVVSSLSERGIAKQIDTILLTQMCQMWSLYCKSFELAKVDPTDKELRCAVVAYRREFDSIAARFGLTAADRQRLNGPSAKKKKGLPKRNPNMRVVG